MKYKSIFWDWNGTLLDDAYASFEAVNAMLTKRTLPLITFDQYRDYIDVPIIRFYERVMDVSNESMDALSVEFNTYVKQFLPQPPITDQTLHLLNKLFENGCKQYIFSSSHNDRIIPYLDIFGMTDYFDAVLGASDCYVTSKVQRTVNYIRENTIPPSDAVFIGDMAHDYDVASEVGADCILISSGHQCRSALVKTGSTVVDSISELSTLLF